MLVVTANWGIGDGTLGTGPAAGRGRAFAVAIGRTAARAGCRADGRYRPVERIDVVFAGDTFDWLVSRRWSTGVKPWDGDRGAAALRREVARRSLALAWGALHDVVRLARTGVAVPAAGSRGRPALDRPVRVPLGLVLLAGDRDHWLEGAGGRRLAARMGIAVGAGVGSAGVAIHHGHDTGPPDRSRSGPGADGGPTLLESVLVDLVVPFALALAGTAGAALVRRLAAVESPLDMPAVVAAAVEALPAADGGGPRLVEAWRRSVDGWWSRARRSRPCSAAPFDPIDALATWLEAVAPLPAHRPSPWLEAVTGLPDPRAFAAAAGLVVLGHPRGGSAPGGVRCISLGPSPPGRGAAAGGATTVGGAGATWMVPMATAADPARAVVVDGPGGAGVVQAIEGFDDPFRSVVPSPADPGAKGRPREAA